MAGGAARLAGLSKEAALQRLVRTGSSDRALTGADVAAMIALVERAPCYQLVYSGLDDAVAQIENLMFEQQ